MTDERSASDLVDDLHRRTGAKRRSLRRELDRLVERGIDPEAAARTVAYRRETPPEESIFEIAAVGDYRGHHLREAGYDGVAAVAAASKSELAGVDGVGEAFVPVIAESARALRDGRDVAAETARELGADVEALRTALNALRAAGVTVSDATGTLELLYAPENRPSVADVDGLDPRRAYFLARAGYERIEDVAAATPDALEGLRYFGATTAAEAVERAREWRRTRGAATGGESGISLSAAPETASESYPEAMTDRDQWLLWRPREGRKVPFAPWNDERWPNWTDSDHWVSFETARAARENHRDAGLAFTLTAADPVVFLDYDDVRSADGTVEPVVRDHVEAAGTYAAVSTSGTGIHVFAGGALSEDVRTVEEPLSETESGSIEVYDRKRFVAVTGDRLAEAPAEVRDCASFLESVESEYATVGASTPDEGVAEPRRTREEVRTMEETDEIRDLFDAIRHVRPDDIRLRSPVTEVRADGTKSRDPSWTSSESGTRLGELDDCWIYRKGNRRLDALQVVALEERIVTDEREYPEEGDFWEAVEALRDRGAAIPRYVPDGAGGE